MRKLTKLIGVALIATSMMASFTGCSGLYNQIDELEKELAEEKAKNDKLTEEKDKAEEELAEELKKNADLVAQIKELEATIESSTKKAEDLTTEIIALKEAAENNELTDAQKAAYEKELNDLKAERTRLEKVITDTQIELDTAKGKLTELETKISMLEDELEGEIVTYKIYNSEGIETSNYDIGSLPKRMRKSEKDTFKVKLGRGCKLCESEEDNTNVTVDVTAFPIIKITVEIN